MKANNQTTAKIANRKLILKLIMTRTPITRAELARLTGLSKMAVTNIVGELLADGIIMESDKMRTSSGRNPITLQILPDSRLVIGLYISRDEITAFTGDLCGNIMHREVYPLSHETNRTLSDKLIAAVDKQLEYAGDSRVLGIGVSCIGPLDNQKGRLLNPPNFFEVENLEIRKLLRQKYQMHVYVDNDMNTSAIAEKYFGHAKEMSNFIYLGVSNGIGAGIMSNNRLCVGDSGFAGEVGHITVNMDGPKCACGNNGCLELYASIRKDLHAKTREEQQAELGRITPYLAAACVSLMNLFDPEAIFLGHDIAVLEGDPAQILYRQLDKRYLSSRHKSVDIRLSHFREMAPVYGAIALCIDRLTHIR